MNLIYSIIGIYLDTQNVKLNLNTIDVPVVSGQHSRKSLIYSPYLGGITPTPSVMR